VGDSGALFHPGGRLRRLFILTKRSPPRRRVRREKRIPVRGDVRHGGRFRVGPTFRWRAHGSGFPEEGGTLVPVGEGSAAGPDPGSEKGDLNMTAGS
jgi:hypothetical protein